MEDWPKDKPTHEFGVLPVLNVDGFNIGQTLAVVLYLGRSFNLLGKSTEDEAEIVSLLCSFEDWYPKLAPAVYEFLPNFNETKEKASKEFLGVIPKFLKIYEARLKKNGGDYMLGKTFSVADIFITCVVKQYFYARDWRIKEWFPVLETHAPGIVSLVKRIETNELSNFFSSGEFIKDSPC